MFFCIQSKHTSPKNTLAEILPRQHIKRLRLRCTKITIVILIIIILHAYRNVNKKSVYAYY